MTHKTSPTNPKGYAVEPFDFAGPEERGNPLDAVSRDAEPRDDSQDGASDEALAELLRRNFGDALPAKVDKEHFFTELLEFLRDEGALASSRPMLTASGKVPKEVLDKLAHYTKLSNLLIKIMYRLKEKLNGASPTAGRVEIFAALHAADLPEFDAINCNLNMAQFAATVTTHYAVKRDARGQEIFRQIKKLTAELARHETRKPKLLTKAAANNAVLDIQKHLGLPERADQRDDTSAMTEARNKQLKK